MSKKQSVNQIQIQDLLDKAYKAKSDSQALELVEKVLSIDPENPEALMIKADRINDDERDNYRGKLELINRALSSLETGAHDYDSDDSEDRDVLFYALKQRLLFTHFDRREFEKVLEIARELMQNDPEDFAVINLNEVARTLYYASLIELRRWQEILSDTMRDEIHDAAWAYSRLVGVFMLSQDKRTNNHVCARMFCEALGIAPDVPFYILGYKSPEEVEDDDESDELGISEFDIALMFSCLSEISDEFSTWFAKGTMLFGLFTNRFKREYDYIIDALDNFGGYHEYEVMSRELFECDDAAVLEMMASHGFPMR